MMVRGLEQLSFTQGCNRKCFNCHNPSTWDFEGGIEVDEKELAMELQEKSYTKKSQYQEENHYYKKSTA